MTMSNAAPTPIASARKGGLKGWHVLAILLGFFGTVIAVNVTMATLAIRTFSGLDGNDSYQRGLDYNKTIAEQAEQQRLGWSNAMTFTADGNAVRLTLTDRQAHPVEGLAVAGTIGRGATDRFDRGLVFHEAAAGIYEAPLNALAPGTWQVSLEAKGAAGTYRLKERLWLKKPQ